MANEPTAPVLAHAVKELWLRRRLTQEDAGRELRFSNPSGEAHG